MSHRVTIRVMGELLSWVKESSRLTCVAESRRVCVQIDRARGTAAATKDLCDTLVRSAGGLLIFRRIGAIPRVPGSAENQGARDWWLRARTRRALLDRTAGGGYPT